MAAGWRWIGVVTVGLATAAAAERPVMRQLPPAVVVERPPSPRQLVDARAALQRRFREPLARASTAGGAMRAAEALLDAARGEEDRSLRWAMLAEARRLAAAAGDAPAVNQAVVLASASFEFDAIETELETLKTIPLRPLSPPRATALAEVAERLATRAATDRRLAAAVAAQTLAVRAWQRAGNPVAAEQAAGLLDQWRRETTATR